MCVCVHFVAYRCGLQLKIYIIVIGVFPFLLALQVLQSKRGHICSEIFIRPFGIIICVLSN